MTSFLYRGPVRAVIFDWAGTVVDFGSRAPASAFQQVFESEGVPITVDEARGPMGMGKREHIQAVCRMPAVAERWREKHGRDCDERDVDRMYAAFVPIQIACIKLHADLVPGTLDTLAALDERGIKIGSTTGYAREMMDVLVPEAAERGFAPDAMVCASDVLEARPSPLMCYRNALALGVWPLEACIKVDDTVPGIEEGRNAGMWTVGVTLTGNELGLSPAELAALPAEERAHRNGVAAARLGTAGAHFVIDGVGDLMAVVDEVERRLARGERP